MTQESRTPTTSSTRPRVAAVVGLTLLEVIRHQDSPKEILESEDPSVTLPRRLGLSEVVERQIRVYRDDVKRGRKLSDDEVRDLVRLVIRRPDAEEVFFRAGRVLANPDGRDRARGPGWRRILPRPLAFGLARRAVKRSLQKLFGRRMGGFGVGPFTLEARAHVLIQSDPGGDACAFATGLCETVVQRWAGREWRITHDHCQAHGEAVCRWTVLAEEGAMEAEKVGDFLLNPEPGTG